MKRIKQRQGPPSFVVDPPTARPYRQRPFADRFWERVDKSGDCWNWLGSKTEKGYARVPIGLQPDGRHHLWYVHRVAYFLTYGPIPEETLDHLCKNRSCVNPAHLESVTQAVNLQRRIKMITCRQGHSDWRHFGKDGKRRYCIACTRIKKGVTNPK